MTRLTTFALFAALALPVSAQAQEACNFESNAGTIAESYDLIGTEACIGFCSETEGCTAWLYTPHNFSPKTAPGYCQLYAEATGTRDPDASAPTQICGQMGG